MKKFSIEMEVRDNELDAQGIVNNANYMVYLSHARHKHAHALGINFDEYARKSQKLIVLSCTMKFKNSLVANDSFVVTSSISKADYPNQWVYHQDIKRASDGKVILKAIFNSTCLNENATSDESKLYIPELINNLI
ncbi:MAG: acyl-CoA thioesterase [Tatlockia sp.]|jgi:acyl-CoA thioester hydrolase